MNGAGSAETRARFDHAASAFASLVAGIAVALPDAADILLLLTGRADLPAGLSVV
ncbi:hypothetical protein [Frankia sp. Cas3]|uniref:hypothetical protein n=1 Tax=Frankia sp. Cas3 TaxID=3073926 RepID=UPI002AD2E432|nr:hypothetical protein [Frankia sp. Cas3]